METEIRLEMISKLLPAGYIIVKQQEDVKQANWNLKDLAKFMNKSEHWVKENFLYPSRRFVDVDNGGMVKFSTGSGSPWVIDSVRMKQYIESHFTDIFG